MLQVGCSDDGSGSGTSNTMTATMTMPTTLSTVSESGSSSGSASETASTTNPTDGSASQSSDPTSTTAEPTGTTMSVEMTTTGSTSVSSDPSASSTGEPPCDVTKATLKPVTPNMMLVLDKSGSMVSNPGGYWDHDADPATPNITRWNSLYQVVQLVVNDFNDGINFGANLFPSTSAKQAYDASACVVNANVEIPVAPKNKDAILNGIPQAGDTSLVGGTPTFSGVTAALNHLKSLDPSVPRAILLVTDGAANCAVGAVPPPLFENYDQALHTLVENAWNVDQIPTYVVGIDTKDVVSGNTQDGNPNGVNSFQKLNELAVQGGRPKDDPNEKFYNAVNQIQLKAALEIIAKDALSCIIPLDEPPFFPEATKVLVGGKEVPKITDCANESGWKYTNPDGPYDAIELCGAACTDLKIAKEADVQFFCDAG